MNIASLCASLHEQRTVERPRSARLNIAGTLPDVDTPILHDPIFAGRRLHPPGAPFAVLSG